MQWRTVTFTTLFTGKSCICCRWLWPHLFVLKLLPDQVGLLCFWVRLNSCLNKFFRMCSIRLKVCFSHLCRLPPTSVNHSSLSSNKRHLAPTAASVDMCSWTSCYFHFLTFWGVVHAGPLTDPHPEVSDQQLFWGADQYDFSVVFHAEVLECFWHFAHHGEKFYLNFMVRRTSDTSQFTFTLISNFI